jgi:hypothetical protein
LKDAVLMTRKEKICRVVIAMLSTVLDMSSLQQFLLLVQLNGIGMRLAVGFLLAGGCKNWRSSHTSWDVRDRDVEIAANKYNNNLFSIRLVKAFLPNLGVNQQICKLLKCKPLPGY